MSRANVCPDHGSPLPPACPQCEEAMRVPVGAMSPDERADELQHWFDIDIVTVDLEMLKGRISELLGRPFWTAELATPWLLVREARTAWHISDLEAHLVGTMDQVFAGKPVVVVRPGSRNSLVPPDS